MDISIKSMPIAADGFIITVSLILLWYTVVRTAVCSRVPRYTVGCTQPYFLTVWLEMMVWGAVTGSDIDIVRGIPRHGAKYFEK